MCLLFDITLMMRVSFFCRAIRCALHAGTPATGTEADSDSEEKEKEKGSTFDASHYRQFRLFVK